MLNEQWNICWE